MPQFLTARTIPVEPIREYLTEREALQRRDLDARRGRIMRRLEESEFIWQKYGIDRVFLYGSLLESDFGPDSDIDLAIEPEIDYSEQLRLFIEVDLLFAEPVDLRPLGKLPFADKIIQTGIVIYERQAIGSKE